MDSKALYQQLTGLFKLNPWRNSVALLILVIAVASALLLVFENNPLMIVALVQLIPLIVVIIDSVRDKLIKGQPSLWPTWLIVIIYSTIIIGLVGLYLNASAIYSYTFLFSLLTVFITLLPRLLKGISVVLVAIPFAGQYLKKVTAPANIYIVLLILVIGAFVDFLIDNNFWPDSIEDLIYFKLSGDSAFLVLFLLLILLPAVIWRQLLWGKYERQLFSRLLAHLSAWLVCSLSIMDFLSDNSFLLDKDVRVLLTGVLLVSPIAIVYWTLQKLKGFTVKPSTQSLSERSDSIQSDIKDFIDVHGHSSRLTSSINRSSAGVFGITGVRGAGKSALTRHVLAQLKEHYFVLEMTAPVRHDADLGFFISVCRSVSRKIMDDMEIILFGKQSGDTAQLKKRFRNITVGILLVVAGFSLLEHFDLLGGVQKSAVLDSSSAQAQVNRINRDSLLRQLPRTKRYLELQIILATERRIMDKLLRQIDSALAEESEADKRLNEKVKYLLLPFSGGKGIYLSLDHDPYDPKSLLNSYNKTLDQKNLNPVHFLDLIIQTNREICNFYGEINNTGLYDRSGAPGIQVIALVKGKVLRDDAFLEDKALRQIKYYFFCKFMGGNQISVDYSQPDLKSLVFSILELAAIKAPLSNLNREIKDQLFTRAPKQPLISDNNKQSENTDTRNEIQGKPGSDKIEDNLVSLLMLEAFKRQDVRLSFDAHRLEILRQYLRIYRQLLDGEVTERLIVSSSTNSEETVVSSFWYLPSLSMQTVTSKLFWLVVILIILTLGMGPLWRGFISLARAMINRRYLNLYYQAGKFIELLSYSTSEQQSHSFGFKGLSLGQTSSRSARDLTLPGLNARYLTFVELIREQYNQKVIIVIDELDKIHDPDQVKALLIEIKGALFSKGCFYLISISEDAARSFRYRLSSGRDIFESTFDEIIEIHQMDVRSGIGMLARREAEIEETERLGEPCLALLVLFGGGIPREIIREARTLSLKMETAADVSYRWVCQFLLTEEISNWISHFGETNLSGEETVKLRDCAQQALKPIELLDTVDETSYAEIGAQLQKCLTIIDPDNLRNTVGFVANHHNVDEVITNSEDKQKARYKMLAADIQACLRLIILATIAELTEKTDNDWGQYEKEILACHHALGDKPALSETLLIELRKKFSLQKIT